MVLIVDMLGSAGPVAEGQDDTKDELAEVVIDGKQASGTSNDVNNGEGEDHDDEALPDDFVYSEGLTTAEAEQLLAEHGRNELPEKVTPSWLVFLNQMRAPMPIMIWIAIVIELAIENWPDAAILLGIQMSNATIGWYETMKSGHAVAALKAGLKPEATVKRDGKFTNVDAALLVPGDCVLLGSGSAVPADCVINDGLIEVDQAALTGESLPVKMKKGDQPKMGSTVVKGEVEGTVRFTGIHTFFGKTADLLNSEKGMDHLQRTLLKIVIVLTGLSCVLVLTAFIYLLARFGDFKDALEYAVVVLVASIPLALEIVVTTTLALGSRELASDGAIVTRLAAIEDLSGMNILCSDKTGTLTLNKMVIQEVPTYVKDLTREQALVTAALAAKWREPPRDALDTLVLTTADLDECDKYEQLDFTPFDPSTKYTGATIKGPDGVTFRVIKGAPNIILKMCKDDAGTKDVIDQAVTAFGSRGIRALAVARSPDDSDDYRIVALLTFLDPPRPDTKKTIADAFAYGVDVKMITGDHLLIARETCRQLGMGDQIADPSNLPEFKVGGKVPKDLGEKYGEQCFTADGFAQVYPEHKFLIVETLRQMGYGVGMTGDGVNDAPALKQADVGVAVQGATDAARAAADIVLTEPGLSTIILGMEVARRIFQRMQNFLTYRISATLQLVFFFFISLFAFEPRDYDPNYPACEDDPEVYCWPEYFFLPVILLMLITLLNDGTMIAIGYDNVFAPDRPAKWNIGALWCVSSVMGIASCFSSLLLLYFALDSPDPDSLFQKLTLPAIDYGKIVTLIYLKVAVSDFLTLFSARTGPKPFWATVPARILALGATGSLIITTIISCLWPEGTLDGRPIQGLTRGSYGLWPLWVWLYCFFWFFVQDFMKVLTYMVMDKFDLFHYRSGAMVATRDGLDFSEPNAALAAGHIETKALDAAVALGTDAVEDVARKSTAPAMARVSQALALQRNSLAPRTSVPGALARKSLVTVDGPADQHRMEEIVRAEQEISQAVKTLDTAEQDEIRPHLERVSAAMERLRRVSAAVDLQRTSQTYRQRPSLSSPVKEESDTNVKLV